MPRRSGRAPPHERGHTLSGKSIRVHPSRAMIFWLESNERYLRNKYVRNRGGGTTVGRVYSAAGFWAPDGVTDTGAEDREFGDVPLTKNQLADLSWAHGYMSNRSKKKGR